MPQWENSKSILGSYNSKNPVFLMFPQEAKIWGLKRLLFMEPSMKGKVQRFKCGTFIQYLLVFHSVHCWMQNEPLSFPEWPRVSVYTLPCLIWD